MREIITLSTLPPWAAVAFALGSLTDSAAGTSADLRSRPWCVGIKAPADSHDDLTHSGVRQDPSFPAYKPLFGQYLDEVTLDVGRSWQTTFAGRQRDYGRTFGPSATQRDDDNGVPPFAQISRIQRNDEHPVANRRIA
jgi:hypothetical protein